jgi:dihydroorotate dehydrogenase (fumarate)
MNLTTKYLGLTLNSPIVVSASPLSEKIDNVKKMEDSGAAAIVLHSLFEEQILLEQLEFEHTTTAGSEGFAESLSFFPQHDEYRLGPEEYLEHIQKAKATVQIPIIASLNGTTDGGWTSYAKKMEEVLTQLNSISTAYLRISIRLAAKLRIIISIYSNQLNQPLRFR